MAHENFRQNVRFALEKLGMSQEQLAELSGSSRPNINRILQGREGVTIERAERIAEALGVPLASLLAAPKKSGRNR